MVSGVLEVTFVYKCTACKNRHVEKYRLNNYRVPSPKTPEGWIKVWDMLFCPNHQVTVKATGWDKERTLSVDGVVLTNETKGADEASRG